MQYVKSTGQKNKGTLYDRISIIFFVINLLTFYKKIDYSFTKNTTVFSSYFLVFTGEYGMEEN